jgi:hypothetical protein
MPASSLATVELFDINATGSRRFGGKVHDLFKSPAHPVN